MSSGSWDITRHGVPVAAVAGIVTTIIVASVWMHGQLREIDTSLAGVGETLVGVQADVRALRERTDERHDDTVRRLNDLDRRSADSSERIHRLEAWRELVHIPQLRGPIPEQQ